MHWLNYILMVVAILIIIIVLMQQSNDDIKDAFSGESSELFKNRKTHGLEKGLKITTVILSLIFVGLAIAIKFITVK